jgi:hypothetical protein
MDSRTLGWREILIREMEHRHDWLSVTAARSRAFRASQRGLLALASWMVLLVVAACLYDATFPAGRCTTHHTRHACLADKPLLASLGSRGCVWHPPRQQCTAPEVAARDTVAVTALALLTALLSVPVNQAVVLFLTTAALRPMVSTPLRKFLAVERKRARVAFGSKGQRGWGAFFRSGREVVDRATVASLPEGDDDDEEEEEEDEDGRTRRKRAKDGGKGRSQRKASSANVTATGEPIPRGSVVEANSGAPPPPPLHPQIEWHKRVVAFTALVESETLRITRTVEASWKELAAHLKQVEDARKEARHRLDRRDSSVDREGTARLVTVAASLGERAEKLRNALRAFEREWNLDMRGGPRPPTRFERLSCDRFYPRLRRRVREEMRLAGRLEAALERAGVEDRNRLLVECQRLDFMACAQRRVYLRYLLGGQSKWEYETMLERPLSPLAKAAGVVVTALMLFAAAVYLRGFSQRQAASTSWGWLASVFLAAAYEPALQLPVAMIHFARVVPPSVCAAIEEDLYQACSPPFDFQRYIPLGPGARWVPCLGCVDPLKA